MKHGKVEAEITLMCYAYNTLGKDIKEIFDVVVANYGNDGKYLFLEFANRNKSNKVFFTEYMNTCFI